MKNNSFLFFLSFLLSVVIIPTSSIASSSFNLNVNKGQETLDMIMKKAGDYCEKVKGMALFYVCQEKVENERHLFEKKNLLKFSMSTLKNIKPRRIRTKTYIYDYQLVKKGKELKEKRILLKENGEEKYEENIEFRPVKYSGTYMVYGPVGFLSKYWQQHFEYKIVGEDVIDDKKAIIIESTPKKEREVNYNYGRVWVDEKDFSILKIEYDPKSIKDYEDELLQSPIGDLSKKVIWATNFGVEKNGVKFPSQQLIQEFYVNSEGESLLIEKITFRYEDYMFFIVETDVKYK